MKKILIILSVLTFAFSALSFAACKKPSEDVLNGWEIAPYADDDFPGEEGYVLLEYKLWTEEELVVPGTYKGKPILFVETDLGKVYSSSVVFSEGIRGVYYTCFGEELFSVSLPNSLLLLDPYTFKNAVNLQYTVKNGVKYLGNEKNPYVYAAGLADETVTDVVLEEGCTALGDFSNSPNLTTFTFSDGIEMIPEEAFAGCERLTTVNFSSKTRWVAARAFYNCKSLEPIDGFSQLQVIGNEAFAYCESLESISLDSAKSIWDGAFVNCTALTEVEIPYTVTEMGTGVFAACSSLQKATFGARVLTLPERTFYRAPLQELTIANFVQGIGNQALYGSSSTLRKVKLSDAITSLSASQFANYSALEEVKLPASLTAIPEFCFMSCTALTQIEIPSKVNKIGEGAFMGCSALESVKIPTSVENIPSHAFMYCQSLSSIVFAKNVKTIGEQAFYGCEGITALTLPETITAIEAEAFGYCPFLTKAVLPNSLISVSYRVFIGCPDLTVYCRSRSEPADWHPDWNTEGVPVVWGYGE